MQGKQRLQKSKGREERKFSRSPKTEEKILPRKPRKPTKPGLSRLPRFPILPSLT